MTTSAFGDERSAASSKSPWVRAILILGHLAIVAALVAVPLSTRREPPKGLPSGPSILECLRIGQEAPSR
jgi:hypothetical protein